MPLPLPDARQTFTPGVRMDTTCLAFFAEQIPCKKTQHGVQQSKGYHHFGKHSQQGKRQKNQRHKGDPIKDRSGHELPRSTSAAEQVEPTDDCKQHANHANQRGFVPDKGAFQEQDLSRARPQKKQRAKRNIKDSRSER